jgi:hypothetical protein
VNSQKFKRAELKPLKSQSKIEPFSERDAQRQTVQLKSHRPDAVKKEFKSQEIQTGAA